jgi:hypothetical protein
MSSTTQTLEELANIHRIWLLSYRSPSQLQPLYLVWYTDTDPDETDRFVTDVAGKIIAHTSVSQLLAQLGQPQGLFVAPATLPEWATQASVLPHIKPIEYDLVGIMQTLQEKVLPESTLEGLTNWINLLGDYRQQDKANQWLAEYEENKLLRKVWHYYYDNLFWPRFNLRDKPPSEPAYVPAPLKINRVTLKRAIEQTMTAFEQQLAF